MSRKAFSRFLWGAVAGVLLAINTGCVTRPAVSVIGGRSAAVGFVPRPAESPGVEAPLSPARVEIRCRRTLNGAVQVTLRSRTGRPMDVELWGMAYAGQGMWEHWWTQHGIRLPPSGSWTALNYEFRFEKLEARDGAGRLLAALDLRQGFPEAPWWDTAYALHARPDWQPFAREERFGQDLAEQFYYLRRVRWRTMAPGDLPTAPADLSLVRLWVIAGVRASALTGAHRELLLRTVLRGWPLIVTGGADRSRLAGWEQAGVLAAPVRGTRMLPGLRSLARRYGLPPLPGPVAVADVGTVRPPARALLAESGVPLVIERPLGMGVLLFVTFDPTRPPFRGSAVETPFWQEWLGRGAADRLSVHVGLDEAPAYRQIRRQLHLEPPTTLALLVASGLYLAALAATLAFRRRIRAVAALSLGAALAALALGPILRGAAPAVAQSGTVYLVSGVRRGTWWGSAEAIQPRTGIVTVRVPGGSADVWRAPRLRLPSDAEIVERPWLERWIPLSIGWLEAPVDAPGSVGFDLEIKGDTVWTRVRNRLPYALQEASVVWDRTATLPLGDLAPGAEIRRPLARAARGGAVKGAAAATAAVYGRTTGWGDTPDTSVTPVLLAYSPRLPAPTLLLDERPVSSRHHAVLLVRSSGWWASGAFRLSPGVAALHVVHAKRWRNAHYWRRGSGWFQLEPGGWTVLEAQLPGGPSARRWDRLELWGDRDSVVSLRLEAFDVIRQQWVAVAAFHGEKRSGPQPPQRFAQQWTPPPIPLADTSWVVPLPSPDRFVDPTTQTVLVRATNAIDAPGGGDVQVEVRGHASAQ